MVRLLIKARVRQIITHGVGARELDACSIGVQRIHIFFPVYYAEQPHIKAVVADRSKLRLRPLNLDI